MKDEKIVKNQDGGLKISGLVTKPLGHVDTVKKYIYIYIYLLYGGECFTGN